MYFKITSKSVLFTYGVLIISMFSSSILALEEKKHTYKDNFDTANPSWSPPQSNTQYRPQVAPNGASYYPHIPYSERSKLVDRRQWKMGRAHDDINVLIAMLDGRTGFDRNKAIKISMSIESTSAHELSDNFHPATIASYYSNTSQNLMSQQAIFNANAMALKTAAKHLTKELFKIPSPGENTVLLPKNANPFAPLGKEQIAVSPGIWDRLNVVLSVCNTCHDNFRR